MALSISNQSLGFSQSQQGSVDWVDLAKTTISASLNVFARLAAADVHTNTLVVGHHIAGNFHLSKEGHFRMHDAIKKLKWCSSLGDVMHIGFGLNHPVRHLADTTNGYSCLALLGALSELSTNSEAAAMVLSALSEVLDISRELRPSIRQWSALVRACEGTLATTNFGCIAQQFVRLTEQFARLGRHSWARNYGWDQVGEPRDVAEVLNAISKISRGELSSITLTGNSTCSWLAAFGHWFFDLSVEIRHTDGTILYKSVGDQAPVQISVLCGAEPINNSLIRGKSYVVKDIDDIISGLHFLFLGRVEWNEVLRTGYGPAGPLLLRMESALSQLLISISHVFQAVAHADPAVSEELQSVLDELYETQCGPELLFQRWIAYHEDSYGLGFLKLARHLLPELKGLDNGIANFAQIPLARSISNFETALVNLAKACSCSQCQDADNEEEKAGDGSEHKCICIVAESIIILIWSLSLLEFDRNIRPSRFGLNEIYDQWVTRLDTDPPYGQRRIGRLLTSLDFSNLPSIAEGLFTGTIVVTKELEGFQSIVNFSSYGMCFITTNLIGLSDRPDQTKVFHILPGTIISQSGSHYKRIRDTHSTKSSYEVKNYQAAASLNEVDTGSTGLEVNIIAKETLDVLRLSFQFKSQSGSIWDIGPAALLRTQLSATGRVHCGHGTRCKAIRHLSSVCTVDGEGSMKNVRQLLGWTDTCPVIIRRMMGNPLARIAALCTSSYTGDYEQADHTGKNLRWVILRVNECLACCVRKGHSYDMVQIIS